MTSRNKHPTVTETSGLSASLSPQTRRDLCEIGKLGIVDRLPILAAHEDEQQALTEHAQKLTEGLQSPEGITALRNLLAKRLATIDVEVQRLVFVQDNLLRRQDLSRADISMVKDISKILGATHRRFTAAAELYRRLSAPSVTLNIGNAENVAVVDGGRKT